MTTVPTLHVQERPANGEPSVWIRGTVDRRWALELFTNLVHADSVTERRFSPETGHRLVLLADGPGELHPDNTRLRWERALLRECADRLIRAARVLEAEGADPAGALAQRGYTPTPEDVQRWRVEKPAAAAGARRYAEHLRGMVERDPRGDVDADDRVEAELVVRAARCGGTIVDGPHLDEDERNLIVCSGRFRRVANPGQLAYFRLIDPAAQAVANV